MTKAETIVDAAVGGPIALRSTPVRHFCTYFDRRYFSRGLSLYNSLKRHCPSFRLWILCLDDLSHELLSRLQLPEVSLLTLATLEQDDPALQAAKANRPPVEYYFTCTPSLLLFVLRQQPGIELLAYLDADLFFFSDPEPLYDELGPRSIGIIGHRFTPDMRYLETRGIYNVGLLFFRHTTDAQTCLQWWRARCLEACDDCLEEGRFGDQKYLDDWPDRFRSVAVLTHKGANVAVWNLGNYHVTCTGDSVMIDAQPLIFFHYHGLKAIRHWLFALHFSAYGLVPNDTIMRKIFAPYFRALFRSENIARKLVQRQIPAATPSPTHAISRSTGGDSFFARVKGKLGAGRHFGRNILRRNFAVVIRGHVFHVPNQIVARCTGRPDLDTR